MKKLFIVGLITIFLISFSSMAIADSADEFYSYVDYMSAQHRTFFDKKNKLDRKIWKFSIGIDTSVNGENVADLDSILAKIDNIVISFKTSGPDEDDYCAALDEPGSVIDTVESKTYSFAQFLSMVNLTYSVGTCPGYDCYMSRWENPQIPEEDGEEWCFEYYDLTIDVPKKDFSILSAECGMWVVEFNFKDESSTEIQDMWRRETWDGEFVPFAEIWYTDDALSSDNSNSVGFNVNMKSVKVHSLPDRDNPGKMNYVIEWKPINPVFRGDEAPNWPGLEARLGVTFIDEPLGTLPESKINHHLWAGYWTGMPAHLNHYFMPWYYIDFIERIQEEFTSLKGFKLGFHVRTREGAKLREISTNPKEYRIKKYQPWDKTPHGKRR